MMRILLHKSRFGIEDGDFRRLLRSLLVHHHKGKSNPQPDCSFVGTCNHAGIAMPAFIRVGDNRNTSLRRCIKHLARACVSAFAAKFAFVFVDDRWH